MIKFAIPLEHILTTRKTVPPEVDMSPEALRKVFMRKDRHKKLMSALARDPIPQGVTAPTHTKYIRRVITEAVRLKKPNLAAAGTKNIYEQDRARDLAAKLMLKKQTIFDKTRLGALAGYLKRLPRSHKLFTAVAAGIPAITEGTRRLVGSEESVLPEAAVMSATAAGLPFINSKVYDSASQSLMGANASNVPLLTADSVAALKKALKVSAVPIGNTPFVGGPGYAPPSNPKLKGTIGKKVMAFNAWLQSKFGNGFSGHSRRGQVLYSGQSSDILAHELAHSARRHKLTQALGPVSGIFLKKISPILAASSGVFTGDPADSLTTTVLKGGGVGALASLPALPSLLEELKASRAASQALRRTGIVSTLAQQKAVRSRFAKAFGTHVAGRIGPNIGVAVISALLAKTVRKIMSGRKSKE